MSIQDTEDEARELFIERHAELYGVSPSSVRDHLERGNIGTINAYREFCKIWSMTKDRLYGPGGEKHKDGDMGEPACTPRARVVEEGSRVRLNVELLGTDEIAERWSLTYNLGCVLENIESIAHHQPGSPEDRIQFLQQAIYHLQREIDRERRLRE